MAKTASKKAATNEIQVFEEFTDDEVKTIYHYSARTHYQRDEVVFKEKSTEASLYVVLKGKLEAIAYTSDKKKIMLSAIDEGEVFGELSFLDGKERSATILAVKDVELLQISRDSFEKLRLEHPSIASKLIMDLARVVSLRLRNADKFIVDIFQVIKQDGVKESVVKEDKKSKAISKTAKATSKVTKVKEAKKEVVKKSAPVAKSKTTKKVEEKKVTPKVASKAKKK